MQIQDAVTVLDAIIRSRKAVRSFRPDPVPRSALVEILELARLAPSNFNTQPWRVHVLTGKAKQALSEAISRVHAANTHPAFSPFPQPPPADCAARLEDFGRRLCGALGIQRSDMVARGQQTARNFLFFGAPVGLIFTIDSTLTKHSWLDFGLFLQNLMLAAHARGLSTCAQVSFVRYESVIAEQLGFAPNESVTCGMSLGYEDKKAAINHLAMPREPLEKITRWLGFDE